MTAQTKGVDVTPAQIANFLRRERGTGCNCDLDNWEPERMTGHSHVCRIHKMAMTASDDLKRETAAALARFGSRP